MPQHKLTYMIDAPDWISRQKSGDGFVFRLNGRALHAAATTDRFRSLKIPPAWTKVLICPQENGHIQAVGQDNKGRKQYIYHPEWKKLSQAHKFDHMILFGETLPHLRRRVRTDLTKAPLSRPQILATVVWLLEHTLMRIGNDEYAKENHHFGLTTLRDTHVQIKKRKAVFDFEGKSGVFHEIEVTSPRITAIIKQCKDIPGFNLFQYYFEGKHMDVKSEDINEYIYSITKKEFTAKDFRTWGGTTIAGETLHQLGEADTKNKLHENIREAIKIAAAHLGNKPITTKNYYVHPKVISTYEHHALVDCYRQAFRRAHPNLVKPSEMALLTLLKS